MARFHLGGFRDRLDIGQNSTTEDGEARRLRNRKLLAGFELMACLVISVRHNERIVSIRGSSVNLVLVLSFITKEN